MRPAAVEPHVFHGFTDFRRAEHTSSVASPTKLGQYVSQIKVYGVRANSRHVDIVIARFVLIERVVD